MILTCPQCATRYQADAAKFPPQGRNVRCAKCGHVWLQVPPAPETDEPLIVSPEPVRSSEAPKSAMQEQRSVGAEPSLSGFGRPPDSTSESGGRIGRVAGWLLLIIVVFAIAAAGFFFRQEIATVWPQSASFYSLIGFPVNARGIEIQKVSFGTQTKDGQRVLIVTGELANIAGRSVSVPQKIRVGISDGQKREIYAYTFAPELTNLGAGQIAAFRTQLADPPEDARNLDIRFARPDE